jgi:Mrp family chromosome partitioning ATPase
LNSAFGNKQESPYQGLLYSIFQQPRAASGSGQGMVVAITSAILGEGVSHVSGSIAAELASRTSGKILSFELDLLQQGVSGQLFPVSTQPNGPLHSVFQLRPGATGPLTGVTADGWQRSQEYRQECVATWRSNFEYTLIDSPPLLASGEALSVARLVDGYIVVVEANRTQKKQIEYVESQIELAGGKLLGFVLNKRRYLIPEAIFRHL